MRHPDGRRVSMILVLLLLQPQTIDRRGCDARQMELEIELGVICLLASEETAVCLVLHVKYCWSITTTARLAQLPRNPESHEVFSRNKTLRSTKYMPSILPQVFLKEAQEWGVSGNEVREEMGWKGHCLSIFSS